VNGDDTVIIDQTDMTRYELPTTGISLLGYIVRRMHKTQWLVPVPVFVATGQTEEALAHVAAYAVTASTSFGKAYYQPRFNREGEQLSEPDPDTGISVSAQLTSSSPTYKVAYTVKLPHGSSFTGSEEITGTTVGLRGLGMPAPSNFRFQSGAYSIELKGILTSELALALIGGTRIRAYGFLNFNDSAGNSGSFNIDRRQNIELVINEKAWKVSAPFLLEKADA
jgi:hypothetical protein